MPEPGARLYTSNRLEILVRQLAEALESPAGHPLSPEVVVVQNPGVARWLSLRLSERWGGVLGLNVLFPRKLIEAVFGGEGGQSIRSETSSCLDEPTLAWALYELACSLRDEPAMGPLRTYLGEGEPIKRYQLAERLAGLFDQYRLFRPDMLRRWEAGEAGDDWQAVLWCALKKRFPQERDIATLIEQASPAERLRELAPRGRLALFGTSTLPPVYLEGVRRMAAHAQVNIFLLQPTPAYWGDLAEPRTRARALRREERRQGRPVSEADLNYPAGNPLAASLGQQGREFLDGLIDADILPQTETFEPPGETSLLATLQRDCMELADRSGPEEAEKIRPSPEDRSLTVHACYGPRREVEVIRDQLLAALEESPRLRPEEILVMMPDIEHYAPYIHAVFGKEAGPAAIPYSVADRLPRSECPLVELVLRLLELTGERLTSREILDLIELPPVAARFGLGEDVFAELRRWCAQAAIRWGADAAHRERHGGAGEANTWRFGLDRLLLGYAMGAGAEAPIGKLAPVRGLAAGDAELLGCFVRGAETVTGDILGAGKARAAGGWADWLGELTEAYAGSGDAYVQDLRALRAALETLRTSARNAGLEAPLEAGIVRQFLERNLPEPPRGGNFLATGVTFCEFRPLRTVPARVIGLLGMSESAFPRQEPHLSFSRMGPRRAGDRSSRLNDRYLFFETLLAVRERLIITYPGLDPQKGGEGPPSAVVSELLDYVRGSCAGETPAWLLQRHPLHPHDARYFAVDTPLFTFEPPPPPDRAGARSIVFAGEPAGGAQEEELTVSLAGWLRFWTNPARAFLEERLGLRLPGSVADLPETEPFALAGLEAYLVRAELAERFIEGGMAPGFEQVAAEGLLTPSAAGRAQFAAIEQEARAFAGNVHAAREGLPEAASREIDVAATEGVRLQGVLGPFHGERLLLYRPGSERAVDLLRGWLAHLVASKGGFGGETWLLSKNGKATVIPPVQGVAGILSRLAGLYREGMRTPLPFFPETALAYARARRKEPRETALEKARGKYLKRVTSQPVPESHDAHARLAFRGREPLGEEFEATAESVFNPLLEALGK